MSRRRYALVWAALVLAILASILVGCHSWVKPLAGLALPPNVTLRDLPIAEAGPRLGRLVLLIRWPDRDYPAFRAAAIPASTNAIAISIKDADGKSLAEKLIQRKGNDQQVNATIDPPVKSPV